MRRVLRLLLATVLLVALLVAGAAAYLVSGGGFVTYPKAQLDAADGRRLAPEWTAACRADGPGVGSTSTCAAVEGRLLYVQRVDPDGDGDTHLVLLAGTSLHLVKLPSRYRPERIPRRGSRVVAGGWVTRGASGKAEIDARRLCSADAAGRSCAASRAF